MPNNPLSGSTGNRLLDQLPKADSSRLVASGKYIALQQGDIVHRQDRPTTDVYFPTRGCCCHIVTLDEGRRVETTTIGNEGMVGFHLTLGLDWSPLTAVALVPGEALRVPTAAFLDVMKDSEVLENLIRKYAAFCLRYESQIVACNALHSIEQRACRRMLMAHDRVGNADFRSPRSCSAKCWACGASRWRLSPEHSRRPKSSPIDGASSKSSTGVD